MKRYRRSEQGSATIEAAIVLPIFLTVVMSLFMFIRVGIVQMEVSDMLTQAASEIAYNMYVYESYGLAQTFAKDSQTFEEAQVVSADELLASLEVVVLAETEDVDSALSGFALKGSLIDAYKKYQKLNKKHPIKKNSSMAEIKEVYKTAFDTYYSKDDGSEDIYGFILGMEAMGVREGMSELKARVTGSVVAESICEKYGNYSHLEALGCNTATIDYSYSSLFPKGNSECGERDITLIAVYSVKVPIRIIGGEQNADRTYTYVQSAQTKVWADKNR